MRKVTFEKALRYKNFDIVVQSNDLKEFVKEEKSKNSLISRQSDFKKLENIADEMPMPMKKLNEVLHKFIDNIKYIDIMHKAELFVMEDDY